jgi:hypothetical protein
LGPQVEAFLQNYPCASACIFAKHFLTTSLTVKEILQKELGMRKFSRRWVHYSSSDAQKVARVETAKEVLRICRSQKWMILTASQQAAEIPSWAICDITLSKVSARPDIRIICRPGR